MISNELKKRYGAFWEHNLTGGCLMHAVYRSVPDMGPVGPGPMTFEEAHVKWFDIEDRLAMHMDGLNGSTYYADAFPTIFTNFGPGSLAACIGGNFTCQESTVWFDQDPVIKDFSNPPEFKLDFESEMWKGMEGFVRKFCEASGGKYFTSMPDLGGIIDIVASLRGSNELLYDVYDSPDEILQVAETVQKYWMEAYDYLYNIMKKYQHGMTSWQPLWCEGKYYPLQCDFSAMISPDMFDKFVMPEMRALTGFLDNSIYHLDGPEEIPHLDHLLSLPRLDCIQWTAGAGNAIELDECWFDMLNRIQKAGKNVIILPPCNPEMTEKLLKAVNPNQLYILAVSDDEYAIKAVAEMARKIV